MRMSRLFSQTLREAPADVAGDAAQLLARAGFVRQPPGGAATYLPLAARTLAKIEALAQAEVEALGGQKVVLPLAYPANAWPAGERLSPDRSWGRFRDRTGREMLLPANGAALVAELARREIRSYRQLPALLYEVAAGWLDEAANRGGPLATSEHRILRSYSLDADAAGLDVQYQAHRRAWLALFERCNLEALVARSRAQPAGGAAPPGAGTEASNEAPSCERFFSPQPGGETTLLRCDGCGDAATEDVATLRKQLPVHEEPLPREQVATPHASTIEELAALLGVPKSRTAKAVFVVATTSAEARGAGRFVFAVVRGDMEVNEAKLAAAVGATELRPATEAEIRAAGAVPGYASPIGLKDVLVVVDDAIPASPNLVAGANEDGYHLLNVNYGRDYGASLVLDIARARGGDRCARCGAILREQRAVELGSARKLGTVYADELGAYFKDRDGQPRPVVMGSYEVRCEQVLACATERNHDERGLAWPVEIAPYQLHLVGLTGAEQEADGLYDALQDAGIETLYDDREDSAGVKFNDADLIGIPLRLTLGKRSLREGGAELKRRMASQGERVPLDSVVSRVREEIEAQRSDPFLPGACAAGEP